MTRDGQEGSRKIQWIPKFEGTQAASGGQPFAIVRNRDGAKVSKAVRVASGADLQQLARFHTDFHLLDAAVGKLRGGSGKSWNWALAARHRSHVPVILSGGLHEGNVDEGIAAVHPWGVDTASGTEASPGIKDPACLEAFMAAVHAASPAEVPEVPAG